VDLEGTLTPASTADEHLLWLAKHEPLRLLSILTHPSGQGESLADRTGAYSKIDVELLPYRAELLERLRTERERGRPVVLLVDRDRHTAERIAAHLQLFDAIVVTEPTSPVAAQRKRDALVARYGEGGFELVPRIAPAKAALRRWIKAIRLHQWVKNALVFLPALLAHQVFVAPVLRGAVLAFLAFGMCASSVYLFNDLLDLDADRRHFRKRHRPFASGALSVRSGLAVGGLLFAAAAALALSVNLRFAAVLGGYYVLTWAYSLRLKRVALLDVMMLAGLYTIRIIAGSAASDVALSFWLLAFSVFIFLSLGFVKRYAELEVAARGVKIVGHGRGYGGADLPLILSLGTASGYCAIVVIAVYINSMDSLVLYRHHKTLWMICPLLLFWISRVWMLTARGHMHDDPVVFALRDRISLIVVAALALLVLIAI